MRKLRLFLPIFLLIFASLACNAVMGNKETPDIELPPVEVTEEQSMPEQALPLATEETQATEIPLQPAPTEDQPAKYDTEFPLPEKISGFVDMGDGSINFQAEMRLEDAVTFYREKFSEMGFKEREINTAITDSVFSLVFDGHSSGKAIVVQGVDLGSGNININIRLEDV